MKWMVRYIAGVTVVALVVGGLVYLFATAHTPSEPPGGSDMVWGTPPVPMVEVVGTRVNVTKNEITIIMKVNVGSGGIYLASITLPISGTVKGGSLNEQPKKSTDGPIRRVYNEGLH